MRKIPIVGTALCLPPLVPGVASFELEMSAYWYVKTGEATYLRATDAVSENRFGELDAFARMKALQGWAILGFQVPFEWEAGRLVSQPQATDVRQPWATEIGLIQSPRYGR